MKGATGARAVTVKAAALEAAEVSATSAWLPFEVSEERGEADWAAAAGERGTAG